MDRLIDAVFDGTVETPVLKNEHGVERLEHLGMSFWDAFSDVSLRNGFKQYMEQSGKGAYASTIKYERMCRYIKLKEGTVFKRKIKACEDVQAVTSCLLAMFETFHTYHTELYCDVPYVWFDFLDFILRKEHEAAASSGVGDEDQALTQGREEVKIKKSRKISLVFPDGETFIARPSDAIEKFVDYAGIDLVAEKNTKLHNEPLVTKRPSTDCIRYYRPLRDGWYLNTSGDSIAKYRLIAFLNESLHAGVRVNLQ